MQIKHKSIAGLFLMSLALANPASALLEDEKNTIDVFNQTSPFVVYVHNIQRVVDFFYNTHEVQAGTGSAFLWDNQGHVVTNFHVVNGAKKISILVKQGKTVPATVVGVEPKKDIAVLKLSSIADLPLMKGSPAIPVADS